MIQSKEELNEWYKTPDPWEYENDSDDKKRKQILLSEIPDIRYKDVLDIGCGNGFITVDLPGDKIIGADISENAVDFANKNNTKQHVSFESANIFDLTAWDRKFDMILITGVLYPQYIGSSSKLIYLIIDKLLNKNGILVSVHINDWYNCRFPYNLMRENFYPYRQYLHRLEVYQK